MFIFILFFLALPFIPNHHRHRGWLLQFITLSDSHTLDRTSLYEGSILRSGLYLHNAQHSKRHNPACTQRDCNLQSLQATGRRIRLYTVRTLRILLIGGTHILEVGYCQYKTLSLNTILRHFPSSQLIAQSEINEGVPISP